MLLNSYVIYIMKQIMWFVYTGSIKKIQKGQQNVN
jgi:hypothetical protein